MAAPTFVAVATTSGATCNKPAGTAEGDLLVAFTRVAPSSVPSGFTQRATANDGFGQAHRCYTKVAGASEGSSYTFTGASGVIILAVRGNDLSTPFDVAATATIATGAFFGTTPSVTTTKADDIVIRYCGEGGSSLTWTWSTSTERADANGQTVATAEQASPGATGSETVTPNGQINFGGVGITVAIMPTQVTAVAMTVRTPYDVLGEVAATRRLPWEQDEQIAATRRVPYDVLATVATDRRLPYDMTGAIATTCRIAYGIPGTVPVEFRLLYTVTSGVIDPGRRLPYDVLNAVPLERRAPYVLLRSPYAGRYADLILAGAPAAYWRLGEAGLPFADLGSGGNPLTGTGGLAGPPLATRVPGAIRGDADAGVTVSNGLGASTAAQGPNVLDPRLGSMTWEFWFRTTQTTPRSIALRTADTGPSNGILAEPNGSSVAYRPTFTVYGAAGTDESVTATAPAGTTYNDGQWHHFVGVLDRSVNRAYLYVDGVRVVDNAAFRMIGVDVNAVSQRATIGSSGNAFEGDLDEVAIYPRALSEAEVAEHYATGIYDLAAVAAAPRAPYDVLEPVAGGAPRRLPYDVDGAISTTRRLLWEQDAAVPIIRRLPWDVTGAVEAARRLTWTVEQGVTFRVADQFLERGGTLTLAYDMPLQSFTSSGETYITASSQALTSALRDLAADQPNVLTEVG